MKKKNNLFKVVGLVFLVYLVLSWIIPAVSSLGVDLKSATRVQAGLSSFVSVPVEAIGYFINIVLFVLLVGVFYAILEETGVYDKTLEKIANKMKGKEKIFLIATIVIIAIISSVVGLELGLFFIYPFVISLLLLMGYDKLTALTATLGATVVGIYGSTLSGVMYSVSNSITNSLAASISSDAKEVTLYSNILVKVGLLVLGLAALLFFVLRRAGKVKAVVSSKKEEVKEEIKKDVKKEVKKEAKPKKPAKSKGKKNKKDVKKAFAKEEVVIKERATRKVWPLIVVVSIVCVIFILGTIDFESLGTSVFVKFDEWVRGIKIGDFAIFDKLFGSIGALGTWANFEGLSTSVRFTNYSIILFIASIAIAIIYKIKPSRCFEAVERGIKDYIVPAVLTAIAYSVFVLVVYYPAFNTIGTWIINLTKHFNVALAGLFSMISSVLYVGPFYSVGYSMSFLAQQLGKPELFGLLSVMYTNLYGLMMLIAPTSVLLLTSLSITEVSYKEWLKYIWKLFALLFVISFIVFAILFLI